MPGPLDTNVFRDPSDPCMGLDICWNNGEGSVWDNEGHQGQAVPPISIAGVKALAKSGRPSCDVRSARGAWFSMSTLPLAVDATAWTPRPQRFDISDVGCYDASMVVDLPDVLRSHHPLMKARVRRNSFSGTVINIERDVVAGEIICLVRYDDGDLEHLPCPGVRACLDSGSVDA